MTALAVTGKGARPGGAKRSRRRVRVRSVLCRLGSTRGSPGSPLTEAALPGRVRCDLPSTTHLPRGTTVSRTLDSVIFPGNVMGTLQTEASLLFWNQTLFLGM